jgi:hypothetical protein
MIGFIGTYSQLQLIVRVHTLKCFWTAPVWRISRRCLNLGLVSTLSYAIESSHMLRPTVSWPVNHLRFKSQSVILRLTVSKFSKSWFRAPYGAHDPIFITLWHLRTCFCGVPSLTRGRVCLLCMLLALARAVFLGSKSLGTRDHILLSQIWDFPFCRRLRLPVRDLWYYVNKISSSVMLRCWAVDVFSLRGPCQAYIRSSEDCFIRKTSLKAVQ